LNNSQKSYLYAVITVTFWATVATAFKLALKELSVFQLLFLATTTAALILIGQVIWAGNLPLLVSETRQHLTRSLGIACLNPLVYYLVLFAAYDRLPAQIAQPVNYTWALMLVILAIVFLKQRPTRFDLVACVVSYLGVVVIATKGRADFAGTDLLGMCLALASTVIWASYWILSMTDPRDDRVAMCANFVVATPITAMCCFWFSDFSFPLSGVMAAAYIGVFEMGLAFLLWSRALKLAENTSRVSTLIFVSPFLSLFLIHVVLGEEIHLTTYIGLAIIIAGLLIQRLPLLLGSSRAHVPPTVP
jgi:hypothetical protein